MALPNKQSVSVHVLHKSLANTQYCVQHYILSQKQQTYHCFKDISISHVTALLVISLVQKNSSAVLNWIKAQNVY